MIDLKSLNLLDIMPSSLVKDEHVKAVAESINVELKEITKKIRLTLLLARLDELPENLVDELAWQFHVDFYDYKLPIEKKRGLIRQSYFWHKKKGTPWAVQEIVSTLLNKGEVKENWEYGGEPYCFKVDVIDGAIPSEEDLKKLYKAIYAAKNTRSYLEGVNFISNIDQNIYHGGALCLYDEINIYPSAFEVPEVSSKHYFAAVITIYEEVNVKWQTG